MNKTQQSFAYLNRSFKPARFIVKLRDCLTMNKRPFGQISLAVQPRLTNGYSSLDKPEVTPSGIYAYFSIADGDYLVTLSALYYLSKQFSISLPFTLSEKDPESPIDEELTIELEGESVIATVLMLPAPSYLFSPGSILIRILFRSFKNKIPIPDAKIYAVKTVENKKVSVYVGRTDANGQSVLSINRVSSEQIVQINGIDFNGPKKIDIIALDVTSGAYVTQKFVLLDEVFQTINMIIEL
ncbi:hypothetical protein JW979_04490 [bacterium]|nr:hypothetical protein [candidate division CSSED10-310 bacterium]